MGQKKWHVWIMVLFLTLSVLMNFFKPVETYSMRERRNLQTFPDLSMDSIGTGQFMGKFEDYAVDQMAFRTGYLNIRSYFNRFFLRKQDDHGIYVKDGYAAKMEYPLNKASMEHASERLGYVYERYLKDTSSKIYLSIIPDKNYFMAGDSGHLSMDYEAFYTFFQSQMPWAFYMDLTDTLSLENYYKTDLHWRQETLVDTASKILKTLGINSSQVYEKKTWDRMFQGIYAQQSMWVTGEEPLFYLTSDTLEECQVYLMDTQEKVPVYNLEKAEEKDPYDLFLSGSVACMTIENPNARSERELILFRDSFGSSIAPLFVEGYKKITLVDLRYIHPDLLEKYMEFDGQDVLFLYSTSTLNHGETMK